MSTTLYVNADRTWNAAAGYQQLAYNSVLPVIEALDAGKHDAGALLSVAFSPLVHTVLECTLEAGSLGVIKLLQRLRQSPHPDTTIDFVEPRAAWVSLDAVSKRQPAACFDLRPGGSPEFARFPYVALFDHHGRIPRFHQEVLPLVVAVLRGWGTAFLIVHPYPTAQRPVEEIVTQTQAQWATLAHIPFSLGDNDAEQ